MRFLVQNVFSLAKFYRYNGYLRIRGYKSFSGLSEGEVLRSSGGKLSLVTPDSSDSVLPLGRIGADFAVPGPSGIDSTAKSLIEPKPAQSSPEFDLNTFKNYLLVPPLGLRKLFGSELLKVNENRGILYKEYVPGSIVAHNYPLELLPLKYSERIGPDVFVKVFLEDPRDFRITPGGKKRRLSLSPALQEQDSLLLHRVCGRPSLLVLFSGDAPNCQFDAARKWLAHPGLGLIKNHTDSRPPLSGNIPDQMNVIAVLNSPCNKMVWSYNPYLKTLARNVLESNRFMSISKALDNEAIVRLHQYRRQLPSLLLLDRNAYIRWHAVGHPSLEAVAILRESIDRLLD